MQLEAFRTYLNVLYETAQKLRAGLWSIVIVAMPHPALSQTRPTPTISPTVTAGAVIGFDFFSQAAPGFSVQGGLQTGGWFDVGGSIQFWPNVGRRDLDIVTIAAQGVFHPMGRTGWFHPYLLMELGHYHRFGDGYQSFIQTFGFGFDFPIVGPMSARVEGLVLSFGGDGITGEVRSGLTFTGSKPARPSFDRRVPTTVELMWLAPLSGPWRFVVPVYGVSFGTPVTEVFDFVTTFGVFHWQIPDPSRSRGYEWDTGGFWVLPGVHWRLLVSAPRLSLVAGPLVTIMFEGPDSGIQGGLHVGPRAAVNVGPLHVFASASMFWMLRTELDRPEDQRGVLLRFGVGL